MNKLYGTILTLVLALSGYNPLLAEVRHVSLAGDYADFALHPETGDIVALHAEKGEVLHFKANSMETNAEPAAKLRVGSSPVSIVYKEYRDQQVFAVVCSQDSHMYVINADDFSLLSKVALGETGVSLVTSSLNPNDPFLYYCSGSGHDSKTGAVSLVDMKNKGIAFPDSMDCAISASGRFAYRRGPWSPSGFESMSLTSELSDDTPTFTRLFYDHASTAQYLPDPFDQFTAAGKKIYSVSLEKSVAELSFLPLLFFRDRPIVAGVVTNNDSFPQPAAAESTITLRLASYNTFTNIGDDIQLLAPAPKDDGSLPRGAESQADFKRLTKRTRLFADAKRDQLVVASRTSIWHVPMADFNAPREPLLLADLKGADQVYAGEECTLTLEPYDKSVEVSVDDAPAGLQQSGNSLTWTPDKDAIGTASLQVTLKNGDIQRSMKFDVNVSYPSLTLPFSATDMVVDETGSMAVIWEGVRRDAFQQPVPGQTPSTNRIAVVELKDGKVQAERRLASTIANAAFDGKYVFLWEANRSPKIDVLKASDLQRTHSLVAGEMIRDVKAVGDLLVVQTTQSVEVYGLEDLSKIRTFSNGGANQFHSNGETPEVATPHGLYIQNILFDLQLKPIMLLSSNGLPTLSGFDNQYQPTFLRSSQRSGMQNYGQAGSGNGRTPVASLQVPGVKTIVTLSSGMNSFRVPGSVHTMRAIRELVVSASGEVADQQTLVRKESPMPSQPSLPVLKVTRDRAIVVDGKSLYQWDFTATKSDGDAETVHQVSDLQFVPQQSVLVLDSSGTTVLEHKAIGGSSPVKYFLSSVREGFELDENTGTLRIDNKKLMAEAIQSLEEHLVRSRGVEASVVAAFRNMAPRLIEVATPMLGRRPTGAPVAIPIQVDASNEDLASSKIQYFVIAEIPAKAVTERLRAIDKAREAERTGATTRKPGVEAAAGNQQELSRRIEALEKRVDLMTRYLSEILEKLDKQK